MHHLPEANRNRPRSRPTRKVSEPTAHGQPWCADRYSVHPGALRHSTVGEGGSAQDGGAASGNPASGPHHHLRTSGDAGAGVTSRAPPRNPGRRILRPGAVPIAFDGNSAATGNETMCPRRQRQAPSRGSKTGAAAAGGRCRPPDRRRRIVGGGRTTGSTSPDGASSSAAAAGDGR